MVSSQYNGSASQWITSVLTIKNNNYSKITIESISHSGSFETSVPTSYVMVDSDRIYTFNALTNYSNLTVDISQYHDKTNITIYL